MKKFLRLLLMLVVILAACILLNPTEACAATVDDLTFVLSQDGASYSVTDCNTSATGELTIPSTYNGKPVTIIGDGAFEFCNSLTSVNIGDCITTIGENAFYYCMALTSVTIPDSVTTIGEYAFYYCRALTSVTIPNSVTTIGNRAFYDCSSLTGISVAVDNPNYSSDRDGVFFDKHKTKLLQAPGAISGSYVIPDSVTTIGDFAFYYCRALTSVTIPDSVTTIGNKAFYSCSNLTSVTIPDSVITIGDSAFQYCDNLQYTPYSNAKYLGNATNPYFALIEATNEDITQCTIHAATKIVAGGAFYFCPSLTSITIPDSVTTIGSSAFYNCPSLTSVSIPGSVTTIGDSAFQYCEALTSVTIPDSVTTIGDDAFSSCEALTSVTIGDGVTTIGDEAFSSCEALTSVTFGNSVTAIGNRAFYNCASLTGVTIPHGVTTIGDSAFIYCDSLSNVTIPDSVTTIGDGAFIACYKLTNVYYTGTQEQWNAIKIGSYNDSLQRAKLHWVDYCTAYGHTEEVLPGKASTCIENGLTEGKKCSVCGEVLVEQTEIISGHKWIVVEGKEPSCTETGLTEGRKCAVCGEILVAQEVIPACPQTATEGYLTFTLNEDGLGYSVTDCDTSATGVLTIPETFSGLPVTAIGYCTFYNCDSLTEVVIPDSVTAIAGSAFWDCDKLATVHIPDSVIGTIGQRTFARCGSLTDVTIGKSITSIDHYAFYNCTSLKTITIPDGVTSIGYQVFQGCNMLATVSLPDTLTDIGENAFSGCYRLASITIPASVQSIGSSAFSSCTFLTEIVIPEGITRVEKRTFYGCTRLAKVTIPQSVTAIGDYAFSGCTGLADVYYSGTRWDAVTVGNYNVPLLDATLHIPDACAGGHTYGNDFDADCNICGEVRELNNTFKFENYRVVFADPDTTHKNLRVEVYKLGDKTVEDPADEKALKAIDASPATHWGAGNINKILVTEAGNYVLLLKYNIGTGSAIKVPLQISVSADPKLIIDKNNKLTAIDNDGANINHRVVVYYLGDKTVEDIYDEAALTAIDAAPETIWQKTRINRLALTKGGNYVLHLCYNVGTGNKMTVAQQFTVESIPTLSVDINNRVVVTEENAENKNHRAVVYYLGENTVDDPYSESAVKAAAASTSKTYWGLKEINGIEMKEGGNYIVHLYYNVGTSAKRTLAIEATLTERPTLRVDENNKLVVEYSDASITNPRVFIYNLQDKMVADIYNETALKAITTPTQVWGLSEILRKTLTEPGQYVIHLHYNVGTGAKKTVALQVTI